jgi:hypothetical protein
MKYKSSLAILAFFVGVILFMPLFSSMSAVYGEITVPDPGSIPTDIPNVQFSDNPGTSSVTVEPTPVDTTGLNTTTETAVTPDPTPVTQPPVEEPATNTEPADTAATGTESETSTAPEATPVPLMTMEEAIAEAKQQLTEPPPVYDLTNAGIVYGMLSEGVAAWKATLQGNPNEWGIDVGGPVVSSVRPDVVPASLQTFLLQYYKDHPEVGLAFGLDGIEVATQQLADAYNQSVLDLAEKIKKESDEGSVIEGSADDTVAGDNSSTDPDVNDSSPTAVPESDVNSTTSEDVPEMTNTDNGTTDDTQAKVEVIYFGSPT